MFIWLILKSYCKTDSQSACKNKWRTERNWVLILTHHVQKQKTKSIKKQLNNQKLTRDEEADTWDKNKFDSRFVQKHTWACLHVDSPVQSWISTNSGGWSMAKTGAIRILEMKQIQISHKQSHRLDCVVWSNSPILYFNGYCLRSNIVTNAKLHYITAMTSSPKGRISYHVTS